jgi:hypothetical protein
MLFIYGLMEKTPNANQNRHILIFNTMIEASITLKSKSCVDNLENNH